MEQSGWVERLPDPEDRRARLLRITPRARTSLARLGNVGDAVYAEALRGFSPAEIEALMQLMNRLTNNLCAAREAEADAASPEPSASGRTETGVNA